MYTSDDKLIFEAYIENQYKDISWCYAYDNKVPEENKYKVVLINLRLNCEIKLWDLVKFTPNNQSTKYGYVSNKIRTAPNGIQYNIIPTMPKEVLDQYSIEEISKMDNILDI